jgi:hypothetical protein
MAPITTTSTRTTPDKPTAPINCKLLLIGNSSVGKSSLLLRFSDEQWLPEDESSATIGVDFRVRRVLLFCVYVDVDVLTISDGGLGASDEREGEAGQVEYMGAWGVSIFFTC